MIEIVRLVLRKREGFERIRKKIKIKKSVKEV
jgi:hypothetical protein